MVVCKLDGSLCLAIKAPLFESVEGSCKKVSYLLS